MLSTQIALSGHARDRIERLKELAFCVILILEIGPHALALVRPAGLDRGTKTESARHVRHSVCFAL